MLATIEEIDELSILRVSQQKDDWKDEFEDNFNLLNQTKKYLNEHLNKDIYIFIEKENEQIISTCGIQIIDYLPQCNDNGKMGYICNVYTKSEYRNKGIQSKLLKECINFAIEKHVFELQLSTDSEEAIKLYQKIGFVYDNLIMKLEI